MKLVCSQKTCDRGKHFLDYCKLQEFSPCTNHCSINSLVTYLLVAPIMKTFFLAFIPSISVNTWLITRSAAPPDREKCSQILAS
jgi:hypothetical protein